MEELNLTWHQRYREKITKGQKIADKVTKSMGSWKFIIIQSVLILIWLSFNLTAYINGWDPYPFILLNLLFSTQAAYAAPIIMMSQNRQNERDRIQAKADYRTDLAAKKGVDELQKTLARLEKKIDKNLKLLKKKN